VGEGEVVDLSKECRRKKQGRREVTIVSFLGGGGEATCLQKRGKRCLAWAGKEEKRVLLTQETEIVEGALVGGKTRGEP